MHPAPWTLLEIPQAFYEAWRWPNLTSIIIYSVYLLWIGVCSRIVPGQDVLGQPVPSLGGKRLSYRLNGFNTAIVTWVSFFFVTYGLKLFSPTIFHDYYPELLSTALLFAFGLATYLYIAGRFNGRGTYTGNVIADWWNGVELNPHVFGMDLKMYALKVAMIGWVLINFSMAAVQYQTYGTIHHRMLFYQIFTFVYTFDYYWHEPAMLSTWDIISEHYGFMLIFGNFWWMWFAFSTQAWFILYNTDSLSVLYQTSMVTFFCIGYYIFRTSNSQKNQFKLNPDALIWGKKPETLNGRILISGWWGILRKANYLGDWIIAISFAVPCGFSYVWAWFYPIYLIILGIHRAYRDEKKCSEKYGKIWVEYKRRVPYAVIPGIA